MLKQLRTLLVCVYVAGAITFPVYAEDAPPAATQEDIDQQDAPETEPETEQADIAEPDEEAEAPQDEAVQEAEDTQEDTITTPTQEETALGQAYHGEVVEPVPEPEEEGLDELPQEQEIAQLERPTPTKKRREKSMSMQFDKKPLKDIIETFARKKGINVIYPQGDNAIQQTVTFQHESSVSLSHAERYIHLLLDMAGYVMYPHGKHYIIAPKDTQQFSNKPGILYVNVPPHELPRSQEHIQAIYSLANMRVPESAGGNEPINQLLNRTLSHAKTYLFDPQSNSIIMSDNAWNIASAMKTLLALDVTDSPQILETVQLYNSSASRIAQLLNEQIIAKAQGGKGKNAPKISTEQYFAPNVQVVADTRRNRLLLLGKAEATHRVHEFIREHLDAPLESGKSILHVYELQYLDAKEFAEVLKKIVQPVGTQGQQAEKQKGTGPSRYFEGVQIVAEPEKQAEVETAQDVQQSQKMTFGGNRLIIAANSEDWERIKDIIAQLDKPQKQVIVEVMIADVSATSSKSLGAQTRNPSFIDLPKNMNIQAAHLNGTILNKDQTSIVSDLLRLIQPQSGDPSSIAPTLTSGGESGAMLLSLADPYSDNSIWSILKVLDKYTEQQVLSHPYLVTRNNVQAQAKNIDIRRQEGELAENAANTVSPTRKIQDFEAQLIVNVTPRVSSLERLNLQIDIDIQNFIGETVNKLTRKVSTNANMQTGQVLVLGGLSKTEEGRSTNKTPFLGDLPVIGQLFQSQSKTYSPTNLVVFITPTIVEPKLRSGLHRYTNDKVELGYQEAQGAVFDNLHQPITRFFFGGMGEDATPLDDYLDEVQYKQQQLEKLDNTFYYDPQYEIMKTIEPDEQENVQALVERLRDEENPLAAE